MTLEEMIQQSIDSQKEKLNEIYDRVKTTQKEIQKLKANSDDKIKKLKEINHLKNQGYFHEGCLEAYKTIQSEIENVKKRGNKDEV